MLTSAAIHTSRTQNIVFLIISLVLFIIGGLVIYLYVRKLRHEKEEKTDLLAAPNTMNQIFHFWSHLVYLFFIFTAFVGGIVLFFISVGGHW